MFESPQCNQYINTICHKACTCNMYTGRKPLK